MSQNNKSTKQLVFKFLEHNPNIENKDLYREFPQYPPQTIRVCRNEFLNYKKICQPILNDFKQFYTMITTKFFKLIDVVSTHPDHDFGPIFKVLSFTKKESNLINKCERLLLTKEESIQLEGNYKGIPRIH